MQLICLNGQETPLVEITSLHTLLCAAGYDVEKTGFAVAVNQCFVPRSQYTKTWIYPGDTIEIVAPMQGG